MKSQIRAFSKKAGWIAATMVLGLALTAQSARAAGITFQVVESTVPGTTGPTFSADKLDGGYTELLTLSGGPSGTWSATATATFTQYFLGLSQVAIAEIGDTEPNGYVILGSMTSGGTYTTSGQFVVFTVNSASGALSIDADQNGVGDVPLLNVSGVGTGSGGSFNTLTNHGEFQLVFPVSTLLYSPYWPTLAGLQFATQIDGDIDELTTLAGTQTLRGEAHVEFVPVPEPGTLALLGFGLTGALGFARRRKASASA